IENILATQAHDAAASHVILAAHYDSVPAGPGVSDDGTGVATLLEIARAVRQEHFAHPVTFLVDDGEESGLLGAEAFAADQVLAVVRQFANSDLQRTSRGDAVWFDVVTFFIIWWPAAASLWLAIIGLVLTIVAAVKRMRSGATTARAITTGVLAFFAAILA